MANVTARKRGSCWAYRFEGAMVDGKRKQYEHGGFKTKKAALEAGAKAFSEYNDSGLHFKPSEISFADYLDYWMEHYCKVNLKETTIQSYEKKSRNYIKPKLGVYKLKSLSPATLQNFLNDMFNQGYSRNTLAVVKGILSNSLAYAVEPLKFIQNSPMIYVKLPSPRAKAAVPTRKHERDSLTHDQINRIFSRFPEGHSCYLPLLIGYRCGLRLGEAFGLKWSDIDFNTKTLTVNRQVQHLNGSWTFTPPKYDSVRTILLDAQTIKALKAERKRQTENRLLYGEHYTQMLENEDHQINTEKGTPADLIMIRECGTYIQPRVMMHCARVIHGYKGSEVISKTFDFHSLRHTHATMLLEAGANPKAVQQRLGHKNINVTLQIYTHVTELMQTEALAILESM